jgi:hypothetical protein
LLQATKFVTALAISRFNFIGTLAHPSNLVVKASKGRLQLALKLVDSVFDSFRPQRGSEFGERGLFDREDRRRSGTMAMWHGPQVP